MVDMFGLIPILMMIILLVPTIAYGTNESSYQVGFKNGVADGKIEKITEDAFSHTAQYDQEWVNGWCSLPGHRGQYVGSDSDKGTFNCVDDMSNVTTTAHTPTTPTGEYLVPDSNKSAAYNSDFSQGYLGFPLKGHHTSIFLAYKNGTGLYWLNRGEAEGYYNRTS